MTYNFVIKDLRYFIRGIRAERPPSIASAEAKSWRPQIYRDSEVETVITRCLIAQHADYCTLTGNTNSRTTVSYMANLYL
jgi:hypothetical protein